MGLASMLADEPGQTDSRLEGRVPRRSEPIPPKRSRGRMRLDKRANATCQAVNRPRRCIATNAGDSTSIQVRKSIVRNSRSIAGGPQMQAPNVR